MLASSGEILSPSEICGAEGGVSLNISAAALRSAKAYLIVDFSFNNKTCLDDYKLNQSNGKCIVYPRNKTDARLF